MKILGQHLKPLLVQACTKAFPDIGEDKLLELVTVEDPREVGHGDFACPVAFKLAKKLGKSPAEIGQAIVENFPEDFMVGEVSFAAPGYVNLRLSISFLEEELKGLESGFSVEGVPVRKSPIVMDYPSTNAAKPMGVHHIITTILGDSLANILDFMGYEVVRINHLGDWGTQFGKLIYAVETWGDKNVIHANPNQELAKLYVRFEEESEKDSELIDEARAIFKSLEDGDELRLAMWRWIVNESLIDLEKMLKRLGVGIDKHIGESFYLDMTEEVLADGIKRGLFVEGEGGSLIYDMGEDQTPALLRKSDGTTLYLSRDLATAKYRVETWHPEVVLYVVDHAQSLHFKQDFTICEAMGIAEPGQLEHVSFGRMSFADRAMSTRKGNVIWLEDLLDEAAKKALELSKDHGGDLPAEERDALAEILGVGSV
ncbi:MAG: arginine--tRNA ligase, partial [Proteobacteria bacterium]|nr:arginine--tRNA ligase [Pseudomonadota bacterium]